MPLPDATVQVELLDDNGRQCAYGFIDQPVAPGHVYPVSRSSWGWREDNCVKFPVTTVTLRASLVTLRAQRTEYVIQTFPVRYTVRRYPPPPRNPPEAPPKITNLSWNTIDPTAGQPGPGDVVLFECTGSEADGAPVTVTITQRWDGMAPVVHTKAFPAGASSSPSGARFPWGAETPNTAPVPRATIECVVTNDRGQHAVKTTNIPLS
jgi:hypothetical protein